MNSDSDRMLPHLPLIKLLRSRGAQTHEAVVFGNGSRAFPWRCEALHLRHQIQALFYVAEVASLGRYLLIRIRILFPFIFVCTPSLQTRSFGGKFNLTLN